MNTNTIVKHTENNEVEITFDNNGVKKSKKISLSDYVSALNASVKKEKILTTECSFSCIYPTWKHIHTVQHIKCADQKEIFIVLRDNKPIDILYESTQFRNIGVPNLLFAICVFKGVLQWIKAAAVDIPYISEETRLYYYPFAHIASPESRACLGGNRLANKEFKLTSSMIYKIPDKFLSMPNGNDYYNNVNQSQLAMRPLLEALSNNGFPKEWLKKYDKNYSAWVKEIIE